MNYKKRKIYNKKSKIFLSVIIAVGVLGLGIGFAAFTNNLNISSSVTVNPNSSDFKVLLSSASDEVVVGTVDATRYGSNTFASFTPATIDNSSSTSPKIIGLKGTFTVPNSSGQYVFYAINQGNYTAYLKNITFGSKKCTAKPGATEALVTEACKHVRVEVQIGGTGKWYTTSETITNHPLEKGTSEKIIFWMGYDYGTTTTNYHLADGEFDITFGDLTLTYSTTD